MAALVEMEQPSPSSSQAVAAVRGLGVVTVLLLVLGLLGLLVVDPDESRVDGGTPLAAVMGAADRTQGQSARLEMNMQLDMPGGQGVTMKTAGVVDFAREAMDVTMTSPLFTLRMLSDGKLAYMTLPPSMLASAGSPPPTPWVSVPLDALRKTGVGGNAMSSDPMAMFDMLRKSGALIGVVEAGRADVRGVGTTHYEAKVDLFVFAQQYLGEMPGLADASEEDKAQLREVLGQPTLDVYVDDDGLLRRNHLMMTMKTPSGFSRSFTMAFDAATELYDYGVAVDVRPPPADQVTHYKTADEFGRIFGGD